MSAGGDVRAVAEFVRSHSMVAGVVGGVVWAVEVASVREADGSVRTVREWQRVGTTVREAKVWLGY